jgi:hypothetical protein
MLGFWGKVNFSMLDVEDSIEKESSDKSVQAHVFQASREVVLCKYLSHSHSKELTNHPKLITFERGVASKSLKGIVVLKFF